jgi:hypothetical protein
VPAKTQLRLFALGLPIQLALGSGRALVYVVATLFAARVERRIARVFLLGCLDCRRLRAVLADEALRAGPLFNGCAVGGEVFVTGPACLAREIIDYSEKEFGHFGGEDALVVPSEDSVVKLPSVNSRSRNQSQSRF